MRLSLCFLIGDSSIIHYSLFTILLICLKLVLHLCQVLVCLLDLLAET